MDCYADRILKMVFHNKNLLSLRLVCMWSAKRARILTVVSKTRAVCKSKFALRSGDHTSWPFVNTVQCHQGSPIGNLPIRNFTWNTWLRSAEANTRKVFQACALRLGAQLPKNRKRVVVVGSGFAALNFIRSIDPTKYNVQVISPRPYFAFNPLLPSVCSGTLCDRAAYEPIHRFLFRGGKKVMTYNRATVEDVDNENKQIFCKSPEDGKTYSLDYDYLILASGLETNTFGIPGVAENSFFLKEVEDANRINRRVHELVSKAIEPDVSEEEKKRLLHFVVVGGGPTGVEAAGEIADLIVEDFKNIYAELTPYFKISVIEMLPKLLPMFNEHVSKFALKIFQNKINKVVDVHLQTRMVRASRNSITVAEKVDGKEVEKTVPCGMLIWASGVTSNSLSKTLMRKIPMQRENRPPVLHVDGKLLLKGSSNCFAMGDCAYIAPPKLADDAQMLFETAHSSSSGAGTAWLRQNQQRMSTWCYPQLSKTFCDFSDTKAIPPAENLSFDMWKKLLETLDKNYRSPVPTAQNATQAGRFLAYVFNRELYHQLKTTGTDCTSQLQLPTFVPSWRGQMAYIGGMNAAVDLRRISILGGWSSALLWRGVYFTMAYSMNNRMQALMDWIKVAYRGRDSGLPTLPTVTKRTVATENEGVPQSCK